jgi:hypothetical protein
VNYVRELIAGIVVVLALAGAGWGAPGATALPSPGELPRGMVAIVSEVPPGRGRITKAEFQHALVLRARQAGLDSVPKLGGRRYERLRRDAIDDLLEATWIRGEALESGIAVTRRQVSREVGVDQEAELQERSRVSPILE